MGLIHVIIPIRRVNVLLPFDFLTRSFITIIVLFIFVFLYFFFVLMVVVLCVYVDLWKFRAGYFS